MEVFRLRDGAWLLDRVASADAEIGLPPFEAVPLRLGELWTGWPP